jgi:hypothetical protein
VRPGRAAPGTQRSAITSNVPRGHDLVVLTAKFKRRRCATWCRSYCRGGFTPSCVIARLLTAGRQREGSFETLYCFCFAGKFPLSAVFPFNNRSAISFVWPFLSGMFRSQSEYAPLAEALISYESSFNPVIR